MSNTRFYILGACLALLAAPAASDIPANYYSTVDDTNATTLRSTLTALIDGHTVINFSNSTVSFDALARTDVDQADPSQVRLIYADTARPITPNTKASDGDETTGGWNREHGWPQSFFDSNNPMVSDLNSLFPSDADINGQRSNYAYDTVVSGSTDVYGNKNDDTNMLFEPRDSKKGDVARAIFYMDVRYDPSTEADLVIVEDPSELGTSNLKMATLSTLLQWHNQDPPDAWEVERNNRIYTEQGNANPFIDHPEWVPLLYSSASPSVANGDTVSVSGATVAPSTAAQGDVDVLFLSLAVSLVSNEYDIDEIDVQELGTSVDADVSSITLWDDRDNSDTVSAGDVILATTTLSGGAATFTAVAPKRIDGPGTANLLLVATISAGATPGNIVQLRAAANGVRHNDRGGVDTDPIFASIDSGGVTITGSIIPDPGGVNIVAVSTRGADNSASKEYILLANHQTSSVDLTGWELRSRAGGATSSNVNVLSGTIPALGHYILYDDAYVGGDVEGVMVPSQLAGEAATTVVGGMGDTTARSIGLFDDGGTKVDGFSFAGGATNPLDYNDGTPFAGSVSSATTQVYARKRPGATNGPYTDTDDNSNDLEILTTKVPAFDAAVPVELAIFGLE